MQKPLDLPGFGVVMMNWRKRLMQTLGPGLLGGITFSDWISLLRENNVAVDARYWLRAAIITMRSVVNSYGRWREHVVCDEEIQSVLVEPPIFILGIWRSGTTHLQNLLALDPRLATPNWFDVSYPHSFLRGGRPSRLENFLIPRERFQDNMQFGFGRPAEDEFALCTATRRSPMLRWVFPRRAKHYNRYLTLQDVSPRELAEWKAALTWFVRKLAWKYRRPLVLKSPPHTARISHLLDAFPESKFVHIQRHPYAIFQSALHLYRELVKVAALQNVAPDFDELVIRQYREVYDAYFEQRRLIPAKRLVELRFEDLEQDPVGQLRRIYSALELPDFGSVEEVARRYLAFLADYRKNVYSEIPPDTKARIAREWGRCFQEWSYPL